MKVAKVLILVALAVFLVFAVAFAGAGGDSERGKALFNDPTLGGSTNNKSCNTCHPGGRGMEYAATKKFTRFMGFKVGTIEEVINICIEKPLGGKALSNDSQEMLDIVAYIKSKSM